MFDMLLVEILDPVFVAGGVVCVMILEGVETEAVIERVPKVVLVCVIAAFECVLLEVVDPLGLSFLLAVWLRVVLIVRVFVIVSAVLVVEKAVDFGVIPKVVVIGLETVLGDVEVEKAD
jgi:hypothetical protein